MAKILNKTEDVRHATVIGATGVYEVYSHTEGKVITVTAGVRGLDPFVRHTLGVHQEEQADALFDELCTACEAREAVVNLEDYAQTADPDAVDEAEETPDTDEGDDAE